mmetsp:Transcript_26657/g.61322  ORF Transcript_26657/g.61322 Transcript_26657/m.61322 type:complete len:229 (+) Transcript_26657:813-1499(+)
MRVYIQPRRGNFRHKIEISAKIWSEGLHKQTRNLLEALYDLAKMSGSLIVEVVPIHARENDVIQSPRFNRLRDFSRFLQIEGRRSAAGLDCTERASARASVAHDHDRCGRGTGVPVRVGLSAPALSNIGTARLLAYGRETQLTDGGTKRFVVFARGRLSFQPRRLREFFRFDGRDAALGDFNSEGGIGGKRRGTCAAQKIVDGGVLFRKAAAQSRQPTCTFRCLYCHR